MQKTLKIDVSKSGTCSWHVEHDWYLILLVFITALWQSSRLAPCSVAVWTLLMPDATIASEFPLCILLLILNQESKQSNCHYVRQCHLICGLLLELSRGSVASRILLLIVCTVIHTTAHLWVPSLHATLRQNLRGKMWLV